MGPARGHLRVAFLLPPFVRLRRLGPLARLRAVIFIPIPPSNRVLQTSCCTPFFYTNVLQTVLGMGMGMNVTAQPFHQAGVAERWKLSRGFATLTHSRLTQKGARVLETGVSFSVYFAKSQAYFCQPSQSQHGIDPQCKQYIYIYIYLYLFLSLSIYVYIYIYISPMQTIAAHAASNRGVSKARGSDPRVHISLPLSLSIYIYI